MVLGTEALLRALLRLGSRLDGANSLIGVEQVKRGAIEQGDELLLRFAWRQLCRAKRQGVRQQPFGLRPRPRQVRIAGVRCRHRLERAQDSALVGTYERIVTDRLLQQPVNADRLIIELRQAQPMQRIERIEQALTSAGGAGLLEQHIK